MRPAGLEVEIWKAVAQSRDPEEAVGTLTRVLSELGETRLGVEDKNGTASAWLGAQGWRHTRGSKVPRAVREVIGERDALVVRWPLGTTTKIGVVEFGDPQVAEEAGPILAEALACVGRRGVPGAAGGTNEESSTARVRRGEADTIVGASSGLAHVMARVEMVSRQDVPVLLLGETGTGKEVIARAVHVRSKRAGAPFVRVNCGAIPADLMDSELFGHERGSFTGATDRRRGWFERASGGTLLLDEIGELPLEAQVRLLRILQDGSLTRVGGGEPVNVDVRIIAATHRDLPAMVDQRAFREDLWYRIATFPIRLPPLRERVGDIAMLARHFIHKAAVRFGLAEPELDASTREMLERYPWPGNIRELGAVIDRAMILGDGRSLMVAAALGLNPREDGAKVEHPDRSKPGKSGHERVGHERFGPARGAGMAPYPQERWVEDEPEETIPAPARGAASSVASSQPSSIDGETLDGAQRRHIERALEASLGRVEGPFGAARLLAINPNTLRSRMRKLGVDWKKFRKGSGPNED